MNRLVQTQKGSYKQAVQALSEGKTEDGFRQLDKLGWIKEVVEADRYKVLATDYVATVEQGKTALVVSPTHLESNWITDEIRLKLRDSGKLGKEEQAVPILKNAHLAAAERSEYANYAPGDVLVFHQNAKGYAGRSSPYSGHASSPEFALYRRRNQNHPPENAGSRCGVHRCERRKRTSDG